MAARSIASLSLSFGLVSIPVRLYSATESGSTVRFHLLAEDGSRVKQQYVSEKDQHVVPRAEMLKGYEFEKDQFVVFKPDELKALEEDSSHVIEIVAFIPEKAVDPIYYDKAYLLAPDKRGGKPFALLAQAMRQSGRCALAKWNWKAKQYVVQVRPIEEGLVLQQLFYGEEVRSPEELGIEKVSVSDAELKLALQLIDQISRDSYDPNEYEDEEKKRILAAIDQKIAGRQVVASAHNEAATSGQVIDLMEALKASLGKKPTGEAKPGRGARTAAGAKAAEAAVAATAAAEASDRKGAKRATPRRAAAEEAPEAAPVRASRRK